jgi:hypothetical protein
MKYQKLGKLPSSTINFFLAEILKRKKPTVPYQWIHFDEYLNQEFLKIFTNTELEIQWGENKTKPIQKAFYSDPGHGMRIHKDGFQCRSALNIVLSCNSTDWVRWYDEDYINSITSLEFSNKLGQSRNTNLFRYDSIPFIEELHNEIGDVYALDVDTYHSFKCIGSNPRIILQTKFEGFPTFEKIKDSLTKKSFSNLITI